MTDKDNKTETVNRPEKEQKKDQPEGAPKVKHHQRADGETKGAAAATVAEGVAESKPVRAKAIRNVPSGIAHINATFNNTHVTITDLKGGVLAWSSSGRMGFKGTRKSTAYAATVVAQEAVRLVAPCRMQEIEIRVQGPGSGRESAIRAIQAAGLTITVIRDVTPMPHNGCRPRKRRRV